MCITVLNTIAQSTGHRSIIERWPIIVAIQFSFAFTCRHLTCWKYQTRLVKWVISITVLCRSLDTLLQSVRCLTSLYHLPTLSVWWLKWKHSSILVNKNYSFWMQIEILLCSVKPNNSSWCLFHEYVCMCALKDTFLICCTERSPIKWGICIQVHSFGLWLKLLISRNSQSEFVVKAWYELKTCTFLFFA